MTDITTFTNIEVEKLADGYSFKGPNGEDLRTDQILAFILNRLNDVPPHTHKAHEVERDPS